MSSSKLPLKNIAARHKGLTKSIAESYCEAARVCLDRHHTSQKEFILNDDALEKLTIVEWYGRLY